jgi:hypothetical protein
VRVEHFGELRMSIAQTRQRHERLGSCDGIVAICDRLQRCHRTILVARAPGSLCNIGQSWLEELKCAIRASAPVAVALRFQGVQ